jgi:tetraacyldisaccharide-1-P 4'-kinase
LADHALIQPENFSRSDQDWFITEKDAVKCTAWAAEPLHQSLAKRIWVVPLETTLPNAFLEEITHRIACI